MTLSSPEMARSLAWVQGNPSLVHSLQQQAERITTESAHGVFQADRCQNGPKHNCEINISN